MDRGKYETLIEPDYWAYIDQVNAWFPSEIAERPLAEQRAVYDRMCAAFHLGRPDGVTVTDSAVTLTDRAIPVRRYDPPPEPAAIVVYFHGGGFVFGGLDSHDDICAEICAGTGFALVSVDYRLAPEHLHPAAFDDARAVFEHTAAMSTLPIVLCGESAGGNLAAAVAQTTRRSRRTAIGQVLIYPGLGGEMTAGSYVGHANAPLLATSEVAFYRQIRLGRAEASDDPTCEPLRDSDLSGLPPTVIVTAQCDPVSSDGETYRDRIIAAGGRAMWIDEPRLTHSFLRARGTVPRAAQAFEHIVAAIAALGRGRWPY